MIKMMMMMGMYIQARKKVKFNLDDAKSSRKKFILFDDDDNDNDMNIMMIMFIDFTLYVSMMLMFLCRSIIYRLKNFFLG